MGINTDPKRSVGYLCTERVFHESRHDDLAKLFDRINRGAYRIKNKKRLLFKLERGYEKFHVPVLNEVFFANQNVAGLSKYKLKIDSKPEEKVYCTSGIIFSTATGSTSWLYSCKQVNTNTVKEMLQALGEDPGKFDCNQLARWISDQTKFSNSRNRFYYFNREMNTKTDWLPADREGYAVKAEVVSKVPDGMIHIDGHFQKELGIGESFSVEADQRYDLRYLKFLV